jgi:hypothetical protein
MVAGLVLGGYLLTWWYGLVVGTGSVVDTALTELPGLSGILLAAALPVGYWAVVLAQSPLTLVAGVIFWVFPLVANLWRSRSANPERGWAFLDVPPDSRSWRGDAPRVGSALRIGLRGGLVYGALLLAGRVAYHLSLPEATRNQDGIILAFFWGQVALAALVAGVAAGAAARRLHPLAILHGLAAAFGAGATSAIAILILNLAFGGGAEPRFVWTTFSNVVNESALVALPVALVCARRASRRHHHDVGL